MVVLRLLSGLGAGAACLWGVDRAGAQVPDSAAAPDAVVQAFDTAAARSPFTLLPGARVRVDLEDGRRVTGAVLAGFTAQSDSLIICAEPAKDCSSPAEADALGIPHSEIKSLHVRGKENALGFYSGVHVGGLIGGLSNGSFKDPNMPALALGMVVGAMAGWLVGSRIRGWVPVTPCFHACAAGTYPEAR